jgi:D-inositol-3-phosphate glycosyltransferase
MRPRILWVGDAVQPTGFSNVTHSVLGPLTPKYEIHVLGINYNGDPHQYPYPIYPALLGGDVFGVGRFGTLVRKLNPDVVCILQDPWMVARYLDTDAPPHVPIVAYMPVDGKNFANANMIEGLERAIFYTKFGRTEAEIGGWKGKSEVIPHGVDTKMFCPGDRAEARKEIGLYSAVENGFIVGNINRNTFRKRLDLTIQAFAMWWHENGRPNDAYLFLHCSRQDVGYDVVQLARYFGVAKRMILSKVRLGTQQYVSQLDLRNIYRSLNFQITTTMGEGWGLTQLEGMACGIGQAAGQWAALAEWGAGAMEFVNCDTICATPRGVNVLGGVPSASAMARVIGKAYRDRKWCEEMGALGLERARRADFRWESVSDEFDRVFQDVIKEKSSGETASATEEQAADLGTEEGSQTSVAAESIE